ncbi:1,5-anhydro-D-fructose reductase [Vibrio ruber DSM 16370]|uniref:1,5-anhydro-D-fructose reductase n=1 Tax=Vibrio ruber (strain DSM 16370 / JCM 11486 / BCRC 17186 / CECT 7878 / LMG 23124 / VR1) TaxID=1123498 RepID=A0A1R4LT46_VIBR1|nr:Gfo/Idh/MocA family oxidoreductase [Vibrio ruber]SJN59766.1 1,5-anhydro-D-fructose reductase [Vibrio ruber DSM 16370]
MMNKKVRWGIAGLGEIAHRFVKDLTQHVPNGELYAVAARNQLRADAFANEFKCQRSYGSYQALAQDSNVDVVYIATLHPFHRSMVELFLKHGKHVLVEKPAFTNVDDWDAMSSLANEKGLLLVEAMKSVAFPAYQSLRQFILDNQIKINSVEAAFGNWHDFDSQLRIFNPDLCGGATLDVGVYALWLYVDLCHLMQRPVCKPSVKYITDNAHSEVDETVEFMFDGEVKGRIGASITRDLKREAIIKGSELEIVIHDKWWNPQNIDLFYQGKNHRITSPARGGGFEYEIEHVSSLILNHEYQSDVIPAETSRKVIAMMESSLVENGFAHLVHSIG